MKKAIEDERKRPQIARGKKDKVQKRYQTKIETNGDIGCVLREIMYSWIGS